MSTAYMLEHTQEKAPLVDYAIKNMWGNPELDSQFQIKLARVSGPQGFVNDFAYLGKQRYLPKTLTFFHVFTLGGLDAGFWNFGSRGKSWYPMDQWVRASNIATDRGVVIDVYKGDGSMFPRGETYIMPCFDGVTLVCVPINPNFPLPLDKNLYIHCYSSDINTKNLSPENKRKYTVAYSGGIYIQHEDMERVKLNYDSWKAYDMGMVAFFHNGKIVPIDSISLQPGDLIEAFYDPSIEMILKYKYKSMPDYLSDLDKKRKIILFPGFDDLPKMYRYYDDCHFYITNRRNNHSYYYHRNTEDSVRQLTHQDYGMTADYIEFLANRLIKDDTTKKTTMDDIDITVAYHATRWQFKLGPTSSRINDLYLLEDHSKILQAMTGSNSNITEWTAIELEKSPTNKVLNAICPKLTTEMVRDGLGYNGCSVAMSNNAHYMPWKTPGDPDHDPIYPTPPYTSGLGYTVPPTFVESSTAYEYDADGLLLRLVGITNQEYYAPGEGCTYVEYALGRATTWLDYIITKRDVKLKPNYGFRVYKAKWAIDPNWEPLFQEIPVSTDGVIPSLPNGEEIRALMRDEIPEQVDPELPEGGRPVPPWIDITDEVDQWHIDGDYLVWDIDMINWVGLIVFDSAHLYNEFDLSHIDNSLTFAITHQWPIGGVLLPMEPGQIDIWMNRHPLIENVDYILDFPNVYIINKMWLVEGKQHIQYRGVGLSRNGLVNTSELGFVADGVIGYNGRYNLRIDRPTKTIIKGRLFLTPTVDWAEDIHHGNNLVGLNGWPYEVKHYYSANKYVDKWNTYWGYDDARALDKKISDYLTIHATYKSNAPHNPVYLDKDKYRLYSPFLSLIVNELLLGFMTAPVPSGTEVPYPPRLVDEITRPYQWLLKYDPIILGLDLGYFTVHPYNNWDKVTLTPDQLTFVKTVNDLFLDGKLKIEGHFEVKHV
ncbi:putative virion structural protein [Pseudomonas phage OBP]|uniref:putative virion structural protein n=1 Tax=Pseudomonas phage OBP TaxID=1124849 RepID=UPI000240D5E5|nr:putative virion structural protein [Pseudomonas phage OBP]AEV89441.1 putative virion structural protein [Pseudomonas phage OBP]